MFCATAPSGGSLLLRGFVFCCFVVVFFAYLKKICMALTLNMLEIISLLIYFMCFFTFNLFTHH